MEEKEKWYIRGKKGCSKQIMQELRKRGGEIYPSNIPASELDKIYESKDLLFYVIEGHVFSAPISSVFGEKIAIRWQEIKIEEPKPRHTFKPYDKVLMCDAGETEWFATEFSCYNPNDAERYYRAINGDTYSDCIPYEGNEHLNGVKFKPEHIAGYDE